MTAYLLAGVLGVLYALERWERTKLAQRHTDTLDAHAKTLLDVTKWLAGWRPQGTAQPQAEHVGTVEETAARRLDEAIQKGAKTLIEQASVDGIQLSQEEAEEEARRLLQRMGQVIA